MAEEANGGTAGDTNQGGAPSGDGKVDDKGAAGGNAGGTGDAGAGSKGEGGDGNKPAVPEAYEFKMPEGVEIDKDAAAEFSSIAKELKLDQAGAQKVADVAVKMAQRQLEAHAVQVQGWVESAKSDKEFGGEKFDENLATAKKALDTFGSPALRKVLDETGLTNHPDMIRAFWKIGQAISEDGKVMTAGSGATPPPIEHIMYPTMAKTA